jgi:hypothetical protein
LGEVKSQEQSANTETNNEALKKWKQISSAVADFSTDLKRIDIDQNQAIKKRTVPLAASSQPNCDLNTAVIKFIFARFYFTNERNFHFFLFNRVCN